MTVGFNDCVRNYYGTVGRASSSIGSEVLDKTGTVIKNNLVRDDASNVIGSRKRIFMGANDHLKKLGINELQIHRTRGKEPLVLFRTPFNNGKRQTIGFLQKSERNTMANFIKLLKDFKESGIQPKFELLENLLKHVR